MTALQATVLQQWVDSESSGRKEAVTGVALTARAKTYDRFTPDRRLSCGSRPSGALAAYWRSAPVRPATPTDRNRCRTDIVYVSPAPPTSSPESVARVSVVHGRKQPFRVTRSNGARFVHHVAGDHAVPVTSSGAISPRPAAHSPERWSARLLADGFGQARQPRSPTRSQPLPMATTLGRGLRSRERSRSTLRGSASEIHPRQHRQRSQR